MKKITEQSDEKMTELIDKAKARMEELGYSESQMDFIFSDWSDWNSHIKWLLKASKKGIDDWGKSANWGEPEYEENEEDF